MRDLFIKFNYSYYIQIICNGMQILAGSYRVKLIVLQLMYVVISTHHVIFDPLTYIINKGLLITQFRLIKFIISKLCVYLSKLNILGRQFFIA